LKLKPIFTLFAFLIAFSNDAQINLSHKANKKIAKRNWNEARALLDKAIRKDSLNVEPSYVYSLLFFNPQYYLFNVDSSHHYLRTATTYYSLLEENGKEKLKKFPIDETILKNLQLQIDSAAFEKAKLLNTEAAYIHFIKWFPDAAQMPSAIELRDEAAFVIALKQNTHQAFKGFLIKYPTSHRSIEATQRFDKLLFESNTRGKTLEEYQNFVSENPTSQFLEAAFRNIFEIMTEDGKRESFEKFIKQYPENSYSRLASNILSHLPKPLNANDSSATSEIRDWIPVTENGRWGFMDDTGQITYPINLPALEEKYLCSSYSDDFILTQNELLARNGKRIAAGHFTEVVDLGLGFFWAKGDSINFILHKSGWKPDLPEFENAATLNSRFLILRNEKGWGLFAMNSKSILPFAFERIIEQGKFLILAKSGKETLVELDKLPAYSKGKYIPVVADEIKTLGEKYIWVRNGSLEQILNEDLKEIIPFDRHSISFSPAGFITRKGSDIRIKGWTELENSTFRSVQIFEPWLITRKAGEKHSLFHIPTQREIAATADSIWFDQSFAAIKKNDSVRLWQTNTKSFSLPLSENYTIKKAKDSTVFLFVSSKTKISVLFADDFTKVFMIPYRDIEPILKNIFLIREKGKQGLLNEKGQLILKPEYDAILYSNGVFSLLKDKKFGSYNPANKKLIKPSFDSNLITYGKDWIIAKKENKLAFLKPDGLKQSDLEFNEINFWNDSIALVTQNGKGALYSILERKKKMENITEFKIIASESQEQLAIFRWNNFYGLMGNVNGIIYKPEFEELTAQLVNDKWIFLGIKAGKGAVVDVRYFTSSGKVIRSQFLEKEISFSLLCDN